MPVYYILRVKGKAKIPDYVQVRDASFTLVGYFRPGRSARHSAQTVAESAPPTESAERAELFATLERQLADVPFGVITPVEL